MSEGYLGYRRHRPTLEQCVTNSRGVCFMAFARPETIAAALGCTLEQAQQAQEEGLHDFHMMMMGVKQARAELLESLQAKSRGS
jgi:ribosomal protein S11